MNPWNTIQQLEADNSSLAKQAILKPALEYVAEQTGTVSDYTDNDFIQNIFSYIQKDSLLARKYVIENEMLFNRDYPGLLKQMFQYTIDKQDTLNSKQQLVIISEHLYKSAFVLDQEINFSSCCISLESINQGI